MTGNNDFAADLRADVDLQHRINFSVGDDTFRQVAPGDFFCLNGDHRFFFPQHGADSQAGEHERDDGKNHYFAAIFRFCHDSFSYDTSGTNLFCNNYGLAVGLVFFR